MESEKPMEIGSGTSTHASPQRHALVSRMEAALEAHQDRVQSLHALTAGRTGTGCTDRDVILARIAQNVHILQQLAVEADALFGAHDALHEVPA